MRVLEFTKAVAHGNDFVLVEKAELDRLEIDHDQISAFAQVICNRRTGVGADGLEVLGDSSIADSEINLWNSDGSVAELSGNGTRCVAAYLVQADRSLKLCRISTAAGLLDLELIRSAEPHYTFKMRMTDPVYDQSRLVEPLRLSKSAEHEVAILNVGNPQGVLFVDQFPSDWATIGNQIEKHRRFENGTNVSFVRVIDDHEIEVRFWERGAGATPSSGTGSVGAAVAAILTSRASSPVTVRTSAGSMVVDWSDHVYLSGDAQIVATGRFIF